jgi:hypothetical protein
MDKGIAVLAWALATLAIWCSIAAIIILLPVTNGWGIAGLVLLASLSSPTLTTHKD